MSVASGQLGPTGSGAVRSAILPLIALCLAELITVMDNTIVNVAIPTFGVDLEASTTQLAWIVDAYTLVFACLLLPAGKLGDRFGRKLALQVGLAGFVVVSVMSALSSDLNQLITCRALLGIAAALVYPATLSLLTTYYRGTPFLKVAVGVWAATSGVGIALGPIVGGALLEHFSWHALFWVNIPIAIAAMAIIWLKVPESKSSRIGPFDWVGTLGAVTAIGLLVWAILEGPIHGWGSPLVLGAFGVAALAGVGTVIWELRQPDPLIDLTLFRIREFSASAAAISLAFFCLFGFIFVITMYFQALRGYSALDAGIATLPFAFVMALFSPASTLLSLKLGSGWIVGGGLLLMGGGFYQITSLPETASYWGAIVPAMVTMALGLACVQGPATDALMAVAPPDEAGAASAVNDTTREIGGTLGVAVMSSVITSVFGSKLAAKVAGSGMPAEVLASAQESVMATLGIARGLPEPFGDLLEGAGRVAFMNAVHDACWVALGVACAGGLLAWYFLPKRPSAQDASREDANVAEGPLLDGVAEPQDDPV